MEESLEFLPPRRTSETKMVSLKPSISLHTNLYEVILKKFHVFEEYVIETDPPIDDQGIGLFRRIIESHRSLLKMELGMLTSKGRVIWGTKLIQLPILINVPKNEDFSVFLDYVVTVRHIKTLNFNQIYSLNKMDQKKVLRIYSIILREKLNKIGLRQTTGRRFVETNEPPDDIKNYKMLQCYDLKLIPIGQKVHLLVDIGFRILSSLNALEALANLKSKEEKLAFAIGRNVVTTYNNLSYKIQNIRFDMNPFSTFKHKKREQPITFAQYFKEYHDITLLTKNQPLFQTETVIKQKGSGAGFQKDLPSMKVFLIPQFCRFSTTLSEIKETDFGCFTDIAKRIRITPQARKGQENKIVGDINKDSDIFRIQEKCTEVQGFIYNQVQIMAKRKMFSDQGNIKGLKQVKEPMRLQKQGWMFVYSTFKGRIRDIQQAYQTLRDASDLYGIQILQPYYLEVKQQGAANWIRRIQNQWEKNLKLAKNIKIIFLLFDPKETEYYGELKKFISYELKLPCQAVTKKVISNKNRLAIGGRILLQMNAKMGLPLWTVPLKHPYWKNKKIIYGGISITHNRKQQKPKVSSTQRLQQIKEQNKNSYVLGFVGTYTTDMSKIYTNAVMIEKEQQLSEVATFQNLMIDWFKWFSHTNQKARPDVIVLYREILTEKQLNTQGTAQIQALNNIVNLGKLKNPDYNPQIIYILVTKKVSKRIYQPDRSQSAGKFAPPILKNPTPGTIIFQSISTHDISDFHLTVQGVTEGTTTLTNYLIAYDHSQVPEEAIAQFTVQQCYNYPNWLGGIRVPGCLQSADKLSKLVGEHLHQGLPKDNDKKGIQLKPFYL